MELKDLINLLRREGALYGAIILSFVVLGLIWHATQPVVFQANLLLNVGRSAGAVTEEYSYDSFYRLQADERFSDTVVRWLASPRVGEDIFTEAQISAPGSVAGYFSGRRLSSQVIEVTYEGRDQEVLNRLATASVAVLNRYSESLNPEKQEDTWFRVIGSEPVLGDARVPQLQVFLIALFAGVFVGFWTVLIKFYLHQEKTKESLFDFNEN